MVDPVPMFEIVEVKVLAWSTVAVVGDGVEAVRLGRKTTGGGLVSEQETLVLVLVHFHVQTEVPSTLSVLTPAVQL
jgi:hypothetical protein